MAARSAIVPFHKISETQLAHFLVMQYGIVYDSFYACASLEERVQSPTLLKSKAAAEGYLPGQTTTSYTMHAVSTGIKRVAREQRAVTQIKIESSEDEDEDEPESDTSKVAKVVKASLAAEKAQEPVEANEPEKPKGSNKVDKSEDLEADNNPASSNRGRGKGRNRGRGPRGRAQSAGGPRGAGSGRGGATAKGKGRGKGD